jgi:hypothetical protein
MISEEPIAVRIGELRVPDSRAAGLAALYSRAL